MTQHYLRPLFEPQSVAIFGASERENSVGQIVFQNMLEGGFSGKLYPINPKHETVQGKPAYPNLKRIDGAVELAVITTPARTIPDIINDCGEHGVKAAVIISAGFRETGPAGQKLEDTVIQNAKRYGIRFLGPNCLGIMRPYKGLNATFNKGSAKFGNMALISQSGALCTAILDWAHSNDVGFSSVISTGISADVDFGEILDYLAADKHTTSILLYIEGVRQARSFMSALRAAARMKPVIVMKVGRHEAGSLAAKSHTGALVGSDDAFEAALQRAGVVRVDTFGQVFATARALSSRYETYGSRLAIITNGGGPGVMAADRASEVGIQLPRLSPSTLNALNQVLPPTWSHGNPIDIIGDATPERYRDAVKICLDDNHVDGVLVMLTPQAMTAPTEVAQAVIDLADQSPKPVLTCWMGRGQISAARELFVQARIPDYRTPEVAVDAFASLAKYHRNQQLLIQAPESLSHQDPPDIEGAQIIIESVLAERRKVLTEMESKALLSAFRIPISPTAIAKNANEALVLAESLGFPVVMKIHSPDITHKSDVGGVRLNITTPHAVRATFKDLIDKVSAQKPNAKIEGVTIGPMARKPNGRELMIGVIRDPVFGPVISFGAGGINVEVIGDRAVALPPLNNYLVDTLIDTTRISKMLGQLRRMPPIDRDALENVLLRVSEMVCELPWIKEMDLNPLIVDENGALAVDARVVVDFYTPSPDRYAHMAIHPYPAHLVSHWQLADGTDIMIRPIRPEDADIEKEFVHNLSQETKYFRFMQSLQELSPEMVVRFTQIDYDREMAFIAVVEVASQELEVGVCRYTVNPDGLTCEFAIVIADKWQNKGIGHRLMYSLMNAARARGLKMMQGEVLSANHNMLRLVRSLSFITRVEPDDTGITLISKTL